MNRQAKYPALRAASARLSSLFALPFALALALGLGLALAACGDADSITPTEVSAEAAAAAAPARPADLPAEQVDLLRAVRQATSRYHSSTLAAAAGYEETDHCVPAMGYHWVNSPLVDPVFDPMQPEVMIYQDGPNGQPKLVAVEYIVVDVGQPRPTFAGQPFDVGGTPVPVPHWSLHVWLYEENPDGIFTPFNPDIACPAHAVSHSASHADL